MTVFVLLSGANIRRSRISASESAPNVYKTPFAMPSRNASNILLVSIFNPFPECLYLRILKLVSFAVQNIEWSSSERLFDSGGENVSPVFRDDERADPDRRALYTDIFRPHVPYPICFMRATVSSDIMLCVVTVFGANPEMPSSASRMTGSYGGAVSMLSRYFA